MEKQQNVEHRATKKTGFSKNGEKGPAQVLIFAISEILLYTILSFYMKWNEWTGLMCSYYYYLEKK